MNETKFRELLVYAARQSAGDPTFGATKLNKILFYADFAAYWRLGSPITDAEYQHLQDGPAPRLLLPIRAGLIEDGSIRLDVQPYFNYRQERIVALRPPDLTEFSADELAIVNETLEVLHGLGAADVTNMSHQEFGWKMTDDGETIPYFTAWISPEPPSAEQLQLGVEVARRHGMDVTNGHTARA
ncbi:MAG TPA: Panacea domain-containing protein [Candidatus Micrarchaeia archaeon]|nr:Panacea domain-containing protein [Candidatus Micrarchaeia archaeon]